MKKSLTMFLASFLALVFALACLSMPLAEIGVNAAGETLIIDPGHGGSDPGACAFGRRECDDVLRLSLKIGELIGGAASVTYTRTNDSSLSLNDRCVIANRNGNKYFISVHRNAGGGTGIETYYYAGSVDASLATAVNNRLAASAPWRNRGVKTAAFYVIKYTNMAAILTEVGFIDTANDNAMFDQYFNDIAYAIAAGLGDVIGFTPNQSQKTETWVEKAAFDAMVYRDRHNDLVDMTDEQLKAHWLEYGIKEGRASSTVLDLKYYVENNADLKAAFGTDYKAAYEHFITSGFKEHRKSSVLFDGKYYCDNHPDAASIYKDEYMRHYLEHGLPEGRRASATFDVNFYLYMRPDVAANWPDDLSMAARHFAGHGLREGKQGYDSEKPSITEVTVSNITAKGYTVSCKVTDNWGIEKVSFPTWIEGDSQYGSPVWKDGTKNGNTFTFNVKSSDFGSKLALYSTHIYAYDKGGNSNGYAIDHIKVEDPVKEITLIPSSAYVKDGAVLNNVKTETIVEMFLKQFEQNNLKVVDQEDKEISKTDILGTGSKVVLYDGDTIVDAVTVIILGDIDGNGVIDTTDYLRVKSAFLGGFSLDEYQQMSADVDGSSAIDTTDYLRIKAHFLGSYQI